MILTFIVIYDVYSYIVIIWFIVILSDKSNKLHFKHKIRL